jgi:hypothetical protein
MGDDAGSPAIGTRIAMITARTRQLILMRETGPKRPGWHRARVQLIWRLHDALHQAQREAREAREADMAKASDERA